MLRHTIAFFAAFLLVQPAAAPAAEYDLGYVRQGMMMGQFRFGAWPAGQSIRCSDDADRSKELDRLLALPRPLAEMGAVRCALMQVDDKGVWTPARRKVGGAAMEMSATFGPDPQGTKRLVQFFMQGPRSGFDGLVAHFTARFGPPAETGERLVRWTNGKAEAVVMHEGDETALAMLVDLGMQQAMNARLGQRR